MRQLCLVPLNARSDACKDEIDALHDGPLNSFTRPAHRVERIITDASGKVTAIWDDVIDTSLHA